MINKNDLSIKVIDWEPDIKYRVEHTDEGMVVHEKPESEWKDNTTMIGEIIINDHLLKFYMGLKVWSAADYVQQWDEGIQRLNHHDQSCLVVNYSNEKDKSLVMWWVLYKVNKQIHMQYDVIFYSSYKRIIGHKPFTPETCYDFIPPRETHDEDGNKIAEWIIGK